MPERCGDRGSMPTWHYNPLINIAHFQKINELGASPKEPLSADTICSLSNTDGRRHHEENSFSDGCYSRTRGTVIRAGQN
jgi:hypothetical protein